jgi:hypothetical protein
VRKDKPKVPKRVRKAKTARRIKMADLLRHHWKLAIVWALSLVMTGAMTASAQLPRGGQPGFDLLTESPTVVSGNDIGFRIDRTQNGIPIGRLVVRIDGRWVDTDMPSATR